MVGRLWTFPLNLQHSWSLLKRMLVCTFLWLLMVSCRHALLTNCHIRCPFWDRFEQFIWNQLARYRLLQQQIHHYKWIQNIMCPAASLQMGNVVLARSIIQKAIGSCVLFGKLFTIGMQDCLILMRSVVNVSFELESSIVLMCACVVMMQTIYFVTNSCTVWLSLVLKKTFNTLQRRWTIGGKASSNLQDLVCCIQHVQVSRNRLCKTLISESAHIWCECQSLDHTDFEIEWTLGAKDDSQEMYSILYKQTTSWPSVPICEC